MKIDRSQVPLIILLLGILYSLYLQWQIPEQVFFSGDGGLKFILAKQLSGGNWRFDLNLPVANWVADLWQQGLYPFTEPFVYRRIDKYYITFPFTFPLVSSWFYHLWGFRGLYVLPLVCLWIVWFRFYLVCQRLCLGCVGTAMALLLLIFASPLTLYSAMYWEHTLGVMLAFGGISIILINSKSQLNYWRVIISSILIGLAVWIRPEFLCAIAALFTIAAIGSKRPLPSNPKIYLFFAGIAIVVLGFFAANYAIYKIPLGMHSKQVSEKFSLLLRAAIYLENSPKLLYLLIGYFPLSLYAFGAGAMIFLKNKKVLFKNRLNWLMLGQILFIIYLPLILPSSGTGGHGGKQWAARFLLILIPLIILFAINIWRLNNKNKYGYKFDINLLLISACLIIGIYINTCLGTKYLINDYRYRVLPALEFIQASPIQIVAVGDGYISQELTAAFAEKTFFRAETPSDVEKLAAALRDRGNQQFLYVANSPQEFPSLAFATNQKYLVVASHKLGKFGSYNIFQATIN